MTVAVVVLLAMAEEVDAAVEVEGSATVVNLVVVEAAAVVSLVVAEVEGDAVDVLFWQL